MAKICYKCKETKDVVDFYKRSGRGDKHTSCIECVRETSKNNRLKQFGSFRNYNLIRKYGITEDDYNRMYEEQEGKCFLCKRVRDLVVDHNHKTGEVRKLLCQGCNIGIGQFEHDPSLFDKAKEYVLFQK